MNIKYFSLISIISLTICSCSVKDNNTISSPLDKELQDILVTSSNGIGLSYYQLPKSTDFSKIPQDIKNPLNSAKVELGKMLFHETGLGQNPNKLESIQTYSCASCHHAKAGFQACVPQGIGEGGIGFGAQGEQRIPSKTYKATALDIQPIRTPSALNIAYQTTILWNGQFGNTDLNKGTESKWTEGTPKAVNKLGFSGIETQAIAGREVHRLVIDRIFMSRFKSYQNMYEAAFEKESFNDAQKLKLNGALAIAAYERTLLANEAPFQQWLEGNNNAMTIQEKEGAKLFFGKANCSSCHNGPSLANMEFHALGMNDLKNGNYGANAVHNVSVSNSEHKGRGGFTGKEEDMYKFKVPQLYNLKDSPFYGHGASIYSIEDVIRYKNKGLAENANVPKTKLSNKFTPLNLSETEIKSLTAFITNGLYDRNLVRYVPKSLPSGLSFPNNDAKSKLDLGL